MASQVLLARGGGDGLGLNSDDQTAAGQAAALARTDDKKPQAEEEAAAVRKAGSGEEEKKVVSPPRELPPVPMDLSLPEEEVRRGWQLICESVTSRLTRSSVHPSLSWGRSWAWQEGWLQQAVKESQVAPPDQAGQEGLAQEATTPPVVSTTSPPPSC